MKNTVSEIYVPPVAVEIKTTTYDKAASLLIAVLFLIGSTVAVLGGLWLSGMVWEKVNMVPVSLMPMGDESDSDEEEAAEQSELEEESIVEQLEIVMDLINKNADEFTAAYDDSLVPGKYGDGRGKGTGNKGGGRRLEITFEKGMTTAEYAKMLDFFKIELGVLQHGGKVVYVSKLSEKKPTVREGKSEDEQRYYLTWVQGEQERAERELLDRAGVNHKGQLILKFLTPELETEIATQEIERAKGQQGKIRASFFRVDQVGDGYKFVLYDQLYK
jgi:hypothetical protein